MLAGKAACAWKLVSASVRDGSEVGTDTEVEVVGWKWWLRLVELGGGVRGVHRVSRDASRKEAEYDSSPDGSSFASC